MYALSNKSIGCSVSIRILTYTTGRVVQADDAASSRDHTGDCGGTGRGREQGCGGLRTTQRWSGSRVTFTRRLITLGQTLALDTVRPVGYVGFATGPWGGEELAGIAP